MWWILGFSYDAVVGAWQDARLAMAVDKVWHSDACPVYVEAPVGESEGELALRWFLAESAANLLDEAGICWRDFVIGRTNDLPAAAHRLFDAP